MHTHSGDIYHCTEASTARIANAAVATGVGDQKSSLTCSWARRPPKT